MVMQKDTQAIDPLEQLFVKGDEVNRELLRDTLINYVRLDEKGRIFPLFSFFKETNKNKLILLLLARKAISLKTGTDEPIAPAELSKFTDMPRGSLLPALRQLVEEGLADDEDSKYKIFSHAIQKCTDILSREPIVEPRPTQSKEINNKSMRAAIEDLIRQGGLDDWKSAKEILDMVIRRRPQTTYNALYKVILDITGGHELNRIIRNDQWVYRRADV
ncbi:hypothetical protein HYS54_03720 [Candidatus Micrarchaeota archaeon]|nr:hypothetical protein [Candidatus Micrarchaeota archaeon]